MKYEFIKIDEDTTKLKYKDKEFTIKANVKIMSEIQALVMKSRVKMIQDLSKEGQSIKDFTIETTKDGKKYYDNSNKLELERMYQEQATLEYFDIKCNEIFGMSFADLLVDVGVIEQEEADLFGNKLMNALSGTSPSK